MFQLRLQSAYRLLSPDYIDTLYNDASKRDARGVGQSGGILTFATLGRQSSSDFAYARLRYLLCKQVLQQLQHEVATNYFRQLFRQFRRLLGQPSERLLDFLCKNFMGLAWQQTVEMSRDDGT